MYKIDEHIRREHKIYATAIRNFQESWKNLDAAHESGDKAEVAEATKKYADARNILMTMKV